MALCIFIAHTVYYANKLPNIEIAANLKNFCSNPDLSFWKKVRHRIHHIFDNGAENKI